MKYWIVFQRMRMRKIAEFLNTLFVFPEFLKNQFLINQFLIKISLVIYFMKNKNPN